VTTKTETRPKMNRAEGFVKILINAGTNWKGSNVEDRKTVSFSPPENKSENNIKTRRETVMRILTSFNSPSLYIE
jgi:hypothetical protein